VKPGDLVWFSLNWEPWEYSDRLGMLIKLKRIPEGSAGPATYAEIMHENKLWKINLDWVRPYKKEEDNEES